MGMVNGEELGQDREEKSQRGSISFMQKSEPVLSRDCLASAALWLLSVIPFKLSVNNNI